MNVLVLSPHPDDAELYAGGTIAKLKRQGSDLYWVSFSPCDNVKIFNEWMDSLDKYDVFNRSFLHYKRSDFDRYRQDILNDLVKLKQLGDFDYVLTTPPYDIHQDHAVIGQEAIRAFKDSNLLFYLSQRNINDITPKVYFNITEEDLQKKIESIKCYKSQFEMNRTDFDLDYIKSLARVYGRMINVDYAEAFDTYRMVM